MHEDFGKKIVIYGAGFEAERFLCHRKDEFDVEFIVLPDNHGFEDINKNGYDIITNFSGYIMYQKIGMQGGI